MVSTQTLIGKTGIYSPVHQAEREGRIIRLFNDGITNVAVQTLLTSLAFNIPLNSTLFITQLMAQIESFSDNCEFELVRCAGENGSGAVERLSVQLQLFSAVLGLGFQGQNVEFVPAIPVRYKDGWRSVAVQVIANDAAAIVGAGWAGYWEVDP